MTKNGQLRLSASDNGLLRQISCHFERGEESIFSHDFRSVFKLFLQQPAILFHLPSHVTLSEAKSLLFFILHFKLNLAQKKNSFGLSQEN